MESVLADFGYYPSDAELETMTRFIFRLSNGAKGMGWSSNVAIGYDCTLIMRIFGDKGSITWSHDDPTRLRVAKLNSPIEIYNANKDYLCEESRNASRLPAGHPEGFHHAFANLYREFIRHLSDKKQGIIKDPSEYFYPKADEGVNGVRFVNACVASNKNGNVWIDLDKVTDEEAQI